MVAPPFAGPRPRDVAAALALFTVLALVATFPLARHFDDHTVGHVEIESTPRLNAWAMATVVHKLRREPVALFDANAFHPYRNTLAFSEHLFAPAVLGAPVALATGNYVTAYNAVLMMTLVLAALGAYVLAHDLTGSSGAALLAGIAYAFHSFNLNELVRIQILSNQWFPFLVWALLRFFAAPGRGRAAAVGVFYLLQSLSCMYYALYLPLLCVPLLVYLQWRRRVDWRLLVPLGAALGVALLVTGLFAIPYVELGREFGWARPRPESLDLQRYVSVLPGSLVYGTLLPTGDRNQNAAHFPGFVVLTLAAWGLWRGSWTPGGALLKPFLAALAAVSFVMSLGPEIRLGDQSLGWAPYAFLHEHVPGFGAVRYPERFSVLLMLALSALSAGGLAAMARFSRIAVLAACSLAYAEHLALPNVLTPMPTGAGVAEVYRWVAAQPDVRVIAEVPASRYDMERRDALPMWLSTTHWKRTVQGFTGYFPPTYTFLKWRLLHFPDPATVTFLERFGVDTVVVHPDAGRLPEWVAADPRWRVEGPFPGGHVALRLASDGRDPYPPPESAPPLVEIPRDGWSLQASHPGTRAAIDGDSLTSWSTVEPQQQGNFLRIQFPQPVEVARISMELRSPYEFPMRLRIIGHAEQGVVEMPYDADKAYDGLIRKLLHAPLQATIDLDVEPRRVDAIRLRIYESDPYWMRWTVHEIRAYGPRRPPVR